MFLTASIRWSRRLQSCGEPERGPRSCSSFSRLLTLPFFNRYAAEGETFPFFFFRNPLFFPLPYVYFSVGSEPVGFPTTPCFFFLFGSSQREPSGSSLSLSISARKLPTSKRANPCFFGAFCLTFQKQPYRIDPRLSYSALVTPARSVATLSPPSEEPCPRCRDYGQNSLLSSPFRLVGLWVS